MPGIRDRDRGHARWPSRRCSSSSDGSRLRPNSPLRPTSTTPRSTSRPRLTHEAYWAGEAAKLDWYRPWDTVLEWDPPFAKWFNGGQLNVSVNCLDRHVNAGGGDKVAYYWEGEPGDRKVITYDDLYVEVNRAANALQELGVRRGDRVAIYMPMIPELPVAMLACARIGAPHTVVFGGFSAEALADRINDSQAKLVITADGGYRRGKANGLKVNVDEAVQQTPSIEHALVVRRTGQDVTMADGRDLWWHDVVPRQAEWCEPERMESEDMLYLLYTSGTTAKPKGILHTTGGYLTGDHQHASQRLRHQGERRLLGGSRYRLGDRALVHRLRAAGQPHHRHHLRGHTGLAGPQPLVGDHRALRRDDPLHGADGDPRPHEMGSPVRGAARSLLAAAPGYGRRADQPRGLDLVPRAHRRRPLPDRRHLVADRDRRHHDLAPTGNHDDQARVRDQADTRHLRRRGRRPGQSGAAR